MIASRAYTFALRIPFHLLNCWCHTNTNLHQAFWSSSWVNIWLDLSWMIWSTSYHHVTLFVHWSQLNLFFTVAFVHRCQVFAQASPPHSVCCFKASNLAFTLATGPSTQRLVLIFSTLVTWLHVMSHMQWALRSHYMSIASTLSHFSSMAHVAHTSVFVWTNLLCIST